MSPAESPNRLPKVTAVMITRGDRPQLAMGAVRGFVLQKYADKKLLILNSGPRLLPKPHPLVSETLIEQGIRTLGDLRNEAIEIVLADQKWCDGCIMQWDDDDAYHPGRMAVQGRYFAETGLANVLMRQTKLNLLNGEKQICERKRGIEGTILHPAAIVQRYPSDSRGEDTKFLKSLEYEVIDNSPDLYTRQYHGQNTWDESHVMRVD